MQLRHWLATGLSLGFMLAAGGMTLAANPPPADGAPQPEAAAAAPAQPAAEAAPALPKVCVAAGITTRPECEALIAKDKEEAAAKAAAAKAAADQAAAAKAAAEKAAADQVAAQKAAAAKAAADEAAAQKAATDQAAAKAAAEKLAAEKAAAAQAAAEKAAAAKAAEAAATPAPAAAATAADDNAAAKLAAEKAAAAKAAAAEAAAAGGNTPKPEPGAEAGAQTQRIRLPRDCVAAGIKTEADCEAFRTANGKPARGKPAPTEAVTDTTPAATTPAVDAGGQPAAAASGNGRAPAQLQNNQTVVTNQNPTPPVQTVRLARDCVAAGIKTKADCDALHAANGKPTGEKPAPAEAVTNTPAATTPAANTPAAETAAQPVVTEQNPTPPVQTVRLARDCVAAGIKTKADCDALHASRGAGKTPPAGGQPATTEAGTAGPAGQPAPAAGSQPAVVAPATPAGGLPAEVTAAKPGEKKPPVAPPPETAALPDITAGLTASVGSYNASVAALSGGNPAESRDQALANIRTQLNKIDALCKTNKLGTQQCLAQYGVQLAPLPTGQAPAGKPIDIKPVQPVEVIGTLPKGVTQQDVAPLLDSAKDAEAGTAANAGAPGNGKPGQHGRPGRGQGAVQDETPAAVVQQPVSTAPPPVDDKAAQAAIAKPAQITPITQTQGQVIDASNAGPKVQLPQNVTVINQTVVNTTNTTVNNTTNNTTQNNNGPGAQQNNSPGQPFNGQGRRGNNGNNGFGNNGNNGNNGFPNRGPGRGPGGPNGPGPDNSNPIGLGLQVILQLGNELIINSPAQDQRRIAHSDRDRTAYEQLPNNRYRETITRPNGVRIVTVYDRNGDILRRSRFDQSGRETVLAYFDASHDQDLLNWRDPGDDLPPLQLHIPARDYVLDADEADPSQVEQFFAQPPVERVQRLYSIDEVKRSARIRDMVRRLEIGDLTFDTGASTISEDQVGILDNVAQAMLELLQRNPAETFLIEGHTDAVGSDISNLRLSDARAATVAEILTDFYHIPPENLATQGYGERFLKVQTDSAEPLNRRVVIRRITPLVTIAQQDN